MFRSRPKLKAGKANGFLAFTMFTIGKMLHPLALEKTKPQARMKL
jgi:hypothetical protein